MEHEAIERLHRGPMRGAYGRDPGGRGVAAAMSHYTDASGWFAPHPGGFISEAALPWELGRRGSGLWVTVPAGFVFDMSIPRALHWAFDPRDGRYMKAAALHDYALQARGFDRVSSAALFSSALAADRVPAWQNLFFTLSVIAWHWPRSGSRP
jgi:Protein of unknown function (DUF1353)